MPNVFSGDSLAPPEPHRYAYPLACFLFLMSLILALETISVFMYFYAFFIFEYLGRGNFGGAHWHLALTSTLLSFALGYATLKTFRTARVEYRRSTRSLAP